MAAVAAALKKKGFRFPKRKAKSVLEENARNNWQAEIPSESECPRLADLVLGKWTGGGSDGAGGEWHFRRVIYTHSDLYFTREADERVIDSIPLHEISLVEASKGLGVTSRRHGSVIPVAPHESNEAEDESDGESPSLKDCTFDIHTIPDGYNSGRVYRLLVPTRSERDSLVEDLQSAVRTAVKVWKAESQFQRSQQRVKAVFHSDPFQNTVALLIFSNFVTHIAQHQTLPEEGSAMARTLETLDVVFTLLFTVELAINAYAHWAKEFFTDGWSVFDLVAVSISLMSFFMTKIPNGAIFRVMRALRVLRLFGRMRRLRLIITALTTSIIPVLNAFLIMLIVTSIYAMVGISFFGERSSEHFGSFDRAIMTMFLVTAGESWLPDLPPFQDNGVMDSTVVVFCVSFIVIVNWTLLQVSVAILLDNFVTATSAEEKAEALQSYEECKTRADVNSLDPLLAFLTDHFDTNGDLTTRIYQLYQVLDVDQDGTLDFDEILEGLRKLECDPRINLSLEDLERYTAEAGLDPKYARLDRRGFETMIRHQLKEYIQRGLTDAILTCDDAPTSTLIGSTKMMFLLAETRHASMVLKMHQVHAEVRETRLAVLEIVQALRGHSGTTPEQGSPRSQSSQSSPSLRGSESGEEEYRSEADASRFQDIQTEEEGSSTHPHVFLSQISTVGMPKDPLSSENSVVSEFPGKLINSSFAPVNALPGSLEEQMNWPALLSMDDPATARAYADLIFLKAPPAIHRASAGLVLASVTVLLPACSYVS